MQREISKISGLEILEDSVEDLVVEPISHHPGRKVAGVCLGKYVYVVYYCAPVHILVGLSAGS